MLSVKSLIFSCFVENTLEYYRNVLLLKTLKGTFYPSKLQTLLYVNNVPENVRYLHQFFPYNCQLYSQIF